MKKILAGVCLGILLTGCATKFAPMGSEGGYEEQMVRENAYVVTFSGNAFTDKERTRDFAMYRAAQIGQRLKFTHFVVMGESDLSRTENVYTGSTSTTNTAVYGNSATSTTSSLPGVIPMYKPGTTISALYFEGVPEGRYLRVYEVDSVLKELGTKYKLK